MLFYNMRWLVFRDPPSHLCKPQQSVRELKFPDGMNILGRNGNFRTECGWPAMPRRFRPWNQRNARI